MKLKHTLWGGLFPLLILALLGGCSDGSDGKDGADADPALLSCSQISTENLGIANLEITSRDLVIDDETYGDFCQVDGKVNERTGTDGKTYAIGFQMRLPVNWNGRFWYQANGGSDGSVVTANGGNIVNASGADLPLARGFAVLSTDAGHSASDPVNADYAFNAGNIFGLEPQARLDYGYMSVQTMTPIARNIIGRHYGQQPTYSYMGGCSNGGRHGMVAASRYPSYFDGILVGNPGFNLPKSAVQHAWDVQSFQLADPEIYNAFSETDMTLVASSVVAACDALDGLADGIVADLVGCQAAFNLSDLTCPGAKEDTCLTQDQVTALERSMGGPKNSDGEQLYSDWPYDGGIGGLGWRAWKLDSGIPSWGNYPRIVTLGGGSLPLIFTTPPTDFIGTPDNLYEFLTMFDIDVDAPKIYATDSTYTISPMDFMTPPDVDNPTLTDFEAAGGKILIYHGQADPVFSVNDTIKWYEALTDNHTGDATHFARLFVIPGMNHCSGGCATDQFDALTALVDWVENGDTPDELIASINQANTEIPVDWGANRTRPLCVWPEIATYLGQGDIDDAASFVCAEREL